MKGIILAGGTGSRLYPLTKVTNKHLLPVGKYPMIFYPILKLKKAGITNILIVTGTEHMGNVVQLLGSGRDFGVKFTYKVQDEAGGIAQALGLAHEFVGDDRCVVLLGDNIFQDEITPFVEKFKSQQKGARVLIKEVPDPSRYGVPEIKGNKIITIEEKPHNPKSIYCVTGIYMYDPQVFDFISTLKPSQRGELEITDVNNYYIEKNELEYDVLQGFWTDAGTFESLKHACELVERNNLSCDFGKQ
jgi:glucose-1-phosphate thymidylyltransferase